MRAITRRSFDRLLWTGQWSLALTFHLVGMVKLGLPQEVIERHFGISAGSSSTIHAVAVIEVALSMAAVLPAMLRILPELSTLAVAGLGALALFGLLEPATTAGAGMLAPGLGLAVVAALVTWGRVVFPLRRRVAGKVGLGAARSAPIPEPER
jgi:hypothetical protein